jgi:threonine/homoserine/homoserine lactone efflux protein
MLVFAVSAAAVLTPGPAMLAIFGHALSRGSRATLPVVLGNACGAALLIALSIGGLSALLREVPRSLDVLKWAGAAYLVALGVRALRRDPPRAVAAVGGGFIRGLLIALSNPKGLLFFGAVLPQFVNRARPVLPQLGIVAATFVSLELAVTTTVTLTAHGLGPVLRRVTVLRGIQRAGGVILIGAAAIIAVTRVQP